MNSRFISEFVIVKKRYYKLES